MLVAAKCTRSPSRNNPGTGDPMSLQPQAVPASRQKDREASPDSVTAHLINQFPAGIVLRYDPGNTQMEEFIEENELVSYVMMNFLDALALIEKHGTLRSFLSEWQVPIITGTEKDEHVRERTRAQIRRVLEYGQPAIYIPDAGEVYCNEAKRLQRTGLHEYRTRVDWLVEELELHDWEIELLPLVKAMEPWHCEELLPCFQEHGFRNYAFYARQYYGGKRGNQITLLLEHLNNCIDIINPNNLFTIGCLGRVHLGRFPDRVNGTSGFKQFLKCNYDDDRFEAWRDDLEANALNVPRKDHDILSYT